uniref:Uncharacterized protein n=1 Tax=Romanomermis culicivorax TaxID=13658 RepID=A0A915KR84_ROMCU
MNIWHRKDYGNFFKSVSTYNISTNTCDSLQVSKPHTPVDAQSLTAKTPKTILKSAARSSSPIKALTDESLLLAAAAVVAKNHSNPKLLIDFGPEISLDRSPILNQNEDEKSRVDQLFVCSTNDLDRLSVTFFNATDLNQKNDCLSTGNATSSTKDSIKIENSVDLRLVPYS